MSEKQFVVNELEILNEENEWKGEYWWAVVNTQRVEDCFECRNKEVALKLCDFLNKATDDFKWQINHCGKWSAKCKQLDKEIGEQQATIRRLQDLCGKSDGENAKLRIENEQLRQSQDVKEFSALFNQSIALQREIKDLKEENEQLKQEIENIGLNKKNDTIKMIDGKVFIRM